MSKRKNEKMKVYHLMILDDSGSMSSVRDETISGLNEQLISLRKSKEDFADQEQIVCFLTFGVTVDHETLWDKTIDDFQDFSPENYDPSQGGTALLDGIGVGIVKMRDQIQDELTAKTANVIVTILTDGGENSSREFSNEQISSLINEVKATGQWTVAFMGCGDDVFDVAARMGIDRSHTMHYAAGAAGTQNVHRAMAQSRYERTRAYSQAGETSEVNKGVDFFANPEPDMDDTLGKVDDKSEKS